MYKLIKDIAGNINVIQRLSDKASIPLAPSLPEYQEYLKWLAEGNTPLPAEENQSWLAQLTHLQLLV